MHCVSGKPLAVDVHIGHHMPVKTVVVPNFQDARVLKEGSEFVENGFRPLLSLGFLFFTAFLQTRRGFRTVKEVWNAQKNQQRCVIRFCKLLIVVILSIARMSHCTWLKVFVTMAMVLTAPLSPLVF